MKAPFTTSFLGLTLATVFSGTALAAPTVKIRLPERFRVLTNQYFDLRIEASDLASTDATVKVKFNGKDITARLPAPEVSTDNDAAPTSLDKAWTFRRISLDRSGVTKVTAEVSDAAAAQAIDTRIGVQDFDLSLQKKNIVLYIGDALGTAYRDVGRIVAQSSGGRFREGFFDDLQAMDSMPVSGMVMTYALDRVVPDSANAASAWATGNKTIEGAMGVFPDNNDFRFSTANTQGTKQYALDNPRIETLWEYLRRRHGYKTGIVTTSDVTDATPGGEGSHTINRGLGYDISRQYVDGSFQAGPVFDVIMGGGKERFVSRTTSNSGDSRNLATELQARGYAYVESRAALNALPLGSSAPSKVLGLFRTSHMNVAYDKLGLVRPADEPQASFGGFTDQPFLDEMTARALAALGKGGAPFILMVEGASIDKQSHSNHAAGQIWDTIEFDKAVALGRKHAADTRRTLVLVTGDHDQSLHILGTVDTSIPGATQNVRSNVPFVGLNGEVEGFPDYVDANYDGYPENTNRVRVAVGYRTGSHTGSSLPITADGPGALLFTGYFDQTDIFFKMAKALSSPTFLLDAALEVKSKSDALGPNY